jgi:hypothetical protein
MQRAKANGAASPSAWSVQAVSRSQFIEYRKQKLCHAIESVGDCFDFAVGFGNGIERQHNILLLILDRAGHGPTPPSSSGWHGVQQDATIYHRSNAIGSVLQPD